MTWQLRWYISIAQCWSGFKILFIFLWRFVLNKWHNICHVRGMSDVERYQKLPQWSFIKQWGFALALGLLLYHIWMSIITIFWKFQSKFFVNEVLLPVAISTFKIGVLKMSLFLWWMLLCIFMKCWKLVRFKIIYVITTKYDDISKLTWNNVLNIVP